MSSEISLTDTPSLTDRFLGVTAKWIEWFFAGGEVKSIERFGNSFCLVSIESPRLKNANWLPGKRISIRTSMGKFHSFLALDWSEKGFVSFVVSRMENKSLWTWSEKLFRGKSISFLGPHSSTDLKWNAPTVVVLNESHLAYAKLIADQEQMADLRFVFHVECPDETMALATRLSLQNCTVVRRTELAGDTRELAKEVIIQMRAIGTDSAVVMSNRTDCEELDRELSLLRASQGFVLDCKTNL